MAKKAGKDFNLYIGTTLMTSDDAAGVTAAGMVLCKVVADVKLNRGGSQADFSTRENIIKLVKNSQLEISLDIDFKYDPTNTQIIAVENAYNTGGLVAAACMSDLIAASGSRGISANWSVTKCDLDQPLTEAGVMSVTLMPSEHAIPLSIT